MPAILHGRSQRNEELAAQTHGFISVEAYREWRWIEAKELPAQMTWLIAEVANLRARVTELETR